MPNSPHLDDPVYHHAKRESAWILVTWGIFAAWVIGVSAWLGYGSESDTPIETVLGFPKWVFWGVAVPWFAANLVIITFAWKCMEDDPLSDTTPEAASPPINTTKEDVAHPSGNPKS